MARVTVEDCLDNVDNRFELVMLATKLPAAKSRKWLGKTTSLPSLPCVKLLLA